MTATRTARRRALNAAAARPRVVAGYLRLSVDRDGNKIGYDIQRKAIERWARANNYDVVWFKDPDITAGKIEVVRPEYELMLKAVASKEVTGIVVWRLDRLVRLSREFERCFGVVEESGCFIQDVEQGLNTGTEVGKMVVRMLVMVAEMELAAMRSRARAHQQGKAERGELSAGGHRPFGFIGVERDPVTKNQTNKGVALIAHHPQEAKLIQEAAKRITETGASFADIARSWEAAGVRGTNGKWIGVDAVIQILTRPRIAGLREYEVMDEDSDQIHVEYARAVWKGIIDRDTWEKICKLIKVRGARSAETEYLLNDGLAVCDSCGRPMIGNRLPDHKKVPRGNYRCNPSLNAKRDGACGKPLIRSELVENHVVELVLARYAATPNLLDLMRPDSGEDRGEILREAREELREVELELVDLARRYGLPRTHVDKLDKAEWDVLRASLRERKGEAARVIEDATGGLSFPLPGDADLADLPGWFDSLDHGQKRSFLRANVDQVRIKLRASASKAFDPGRVVVVFAGAQDVGAE